MQTEAAIKPMGEIPGWIITLFILAMISLIGIIWSNNTTQDLCGFDLCQKLGMVMMESPTGQVSSFCDEHSAVMYNRGWRIVEP